MALLVVAFYAALMIAWPFIAETRRTPAADLDPQTEGNYIALSQGRTWFTLSGPADGPPVVLIHGLTTPSVIWLPLRALLAARGYRVLSYDLYGRGLSDTVRGRQTLAFFRTQLSDLLDRLNVTRPVTLVGYSMGGAIAADFAAGGHVPLARVVLVATAGFDLNEPRFASVCRRLPILGDWLFMTFGAFALRTESAAGPLGQVMRDQLRRRGFLRAVLSSRRGALTADIGDRHRDLAASGVTVAAVWGAQDSVIPLTALGKLAQINRDVAHDAVPDATHALPFTHPHAVMRAIRTGDADAD